ncbi:hypothetical protein VVR84_00195 [Kocuria carniphila]|uniref:Uncharacterized protein n=1 Tax=Kocuria carniphila TaxID=262208 RepID=A0ABV3V0U3_9MICC
MPTRRTGDGSLSVTARVALGAALVLATGTALSPLVFSLDPGEEPTAVSCTTYGLAADDPRAEPTQILDASFRAGSTYSAAGELGEMAQTFTHNGLTGQYHVIDGGVNTNKPVGLVMHLHGDGAREYHDPSGRTTCLAAVAASHNALLVVPRTPDRAQEPTWWENLKGNRDWLTSLVKDRILLDYPVDRNRITWMGYSGGAEMLSYGILAGPRDLVTQGAALVGGGGAPETLDKAATESQLENMPLWWVTGEEDDGSTKSAPFDAVSAAVTGADFYDDEGFEQVDLEILDGHDHYDMPDARILDDLMKAARG